MIEKVGKITLDYTHYPGEDFYCDGVVEQEILDIVKKYSPLEYPKIIEERKSWPILYHLSTLRENIVDWLEKALEDHRTFTICKKGVLYYNQLLNMVL